MLGITNMTAGFVFLFIFFIFFCCYWCAVLLPFSLWGDDRKRCCLQFSLYALSKYSMRGGCRGITDSCLLHVDGHKGFHLSILRRNVRRLPCRGLGWYEDARDSWKFRKWPIPVYTSASLECGGWNQSLLTYFTLKYSSFRGPLKSNLERTNLRKKLNYFELEFVPLKSEVEVKQGRAVSKHEYWF